MAEAFPFAMFWLIETVVTYSVGIVLAGAVAFGAVTAFQSLRSPSPGAPLRRSWPG